MNAPMLCARRHDAHAAPLRSAQQRMAHAPLPAAMRYARVLLMKYRGER